MTAFEIRARQGANNELTLGVLYASKGPVARLLENTKITSKNFIDTFKVKGCRSRLKTKEGFLCGKLVTDAITLCEHQFFKTKFTFKKEPNGQFRIVSDKGLCLTKGKQDKWNGGFYVKLQTCKSSSDQLFSVDKIEVRPCNQ